MFVNRIAELKLQKKLSDHQAVFFCSPVSVSSLSNEMIADQVRANLGIVRGGRDTPFSLKFCIILIEFSTKIKINYKAGKWASAVSPPPLFEFSGFAPRDALTKFVLASDVFSFWLKSISQI